jgi:hypothetical protein
MTDDVETEEFTDELSDEALDRDEGGKACSSCSGSSRVG